MATAQEDLRTDDTDIGTKPLQIADTERIAITMIAGTGTLPAGTPLAYNGTGYKKFVAADTDMDAILWPNEVTLDAADDTCTIAMVKGEVKNFNEIKALVAAGADATALEASCKNKALAKGIVVRGITNVNQ